jgi:hypothetical protein
VEYAVNLSDYGALQYTQMIVGITSPPSTMYIALCTEEPTPGGLGTDLVEPADGTGYMRKSIATADWALVSVDTPAVTNTDPYSWTPAVDWLPVSWVALCTSTGTNQVWCWTEIDSFTGITGGTYTLDASSVSLSVSGPSQVVA